MESKSYSTSELIYRYMGYIKGFNNRYCNRINVSLESISIYLYSKGKSIKSFLEIDTLYDYMEECYKESSDATVRYRLDTVEGLLKWCIKNGYIDNELNLKNKLTPSFIKRMYLTKHNINTIFNYCIDITDKTPYTYAREKFIILLTLFDNLPIEVILNLELSYIKDTKCLSDLKDRCNVINKYLKCRKLYIERNNITNYDKLIVLNYKQQGNVSSASVSSSIFNDMRCRLNLPKGITRESLRNFNANYIFG